MNNELSKLQGLDRLEADFKALDRINDKIGRLVANAATTYSRAADALYPLQHFTKGNC